MFELGFNHIHLRYPLPLIESRVLIGMHIRFYPLLSQAIGEPLTYPWILQPNQFVDSCDDLLVGGFKSSEKYEFVNWDDDIPNIWENKNCSKPPTSIGFILFVFVYM